MATPMLLVSGLVADLDWITRLGGASVFLHGHRTATHSLIGTIAISISVATGFWAAGRKFPRLAIGMIPAQALCVVGAGTHLVLDMLSDYGVKLLWPLSSRWYAWDVANSVDAWIIFFLLAGLLLPELFRLIHEEIGSKSKRHRGQRGAITGLILVALFIAGRGFAHQGAVTLLDSREYRGQAPLVVAAFPKPSNPFVWRGVVETDNALFNVDVPVGLGLAFDPDLANVHFKPEPSIALDAAAASATGVEFLEYARFPIANIEPQGDGYEVRFRDMRFETEPPGSLNINAVISLNAQKRVIGERLEYAGTSLP
jgi:inner membrane protein